MNNTSLRFVFDRKKQSSLTTTGLLQVEVREVGTNRRILISTGLRLYKNQFSEKNGFTCVKHDKSSMITIKARKMYSEIEAFVMSDKCLSLSDVHNWNTSGVSSLSVSDFIRSELSKKNPSKATMEHHLGLLRRLEEFGSIRTFRDVNYSNIADFDSYLRKRISSQPVLYKRHSTLKHYLVIAFKRGLLTNIPYGDGPDEFSYAKGRSKEPVFLLESEIEKLQNYEPLTESLEKVKDLFLFQCFSGVAYTDLMNFDVSRLYEAQGFKVYRSSRTKTDESFISVLLPEAEAILLKYNGVLPKISNQNYNSYIKVVAAGAGVGKNITTHTGRHTFATYLLNRDVPIESVSRAMGHASTKQTAHYARMLGKKVISDMAKLLK